LPYSIFIAILHVYGAMTDKYKIYKSLPKCLRSFLTQLVVVRMMKYLSVDNIGQLHCAVRYIFKDDLASSMEINSGFWYAKLHGYQFSRKAKLSRLERLFPQSTDVLNHPLFAYSAMPHIKRKSYAIKQRMKFCHPIFSYHDALDARTGMSIFETDLDGIDSFGHIIDLMKTPNFENVRLLAVSRNLLLSDEGLLLNASLLRPLLKSLLAEVRQIRFEKEIHAMFDSLLH
jgi:hypothetical protein